MSRSRDLCAAGLLLALIFPAHAFEGIGRPATPAEIRAWDIDVRPDFQGLPEGRGSVQRGQEIWEAKCASCHGTFGESNEVFPPLVGGTTPEDARTGRVAALRDRSYPQRTTLMKVATLSTLFDYIRRAMPWNEPRSLSDDDTYAVLAYLLNLGDLVPADFVLDPKTIREVQERLPNRNGMTRAHGLWDVRGKPDVRGTACMKDCVASPRITSSLPEFARNSHGNLAEQNRSFGPVRGIDTSRPPSPQPSPPAHAGGEGGTDTGPSSSPGARAGGEGDVRNGAPPAPGSRKPIADGGDGLALARRSGCLGCHDVEARRVGPSFRELSARYRGDPGAPARLATKVRAGGSGAWGAVPMPPQPQLADEDVASLVRWILEGGP